MPGKVALRVTAGPLSGRSYEFSAHDTFLFGRSPDCHAQLDPSDTTASRHHFLLEVNPPTARLRDLGSLNGTLVNGVRFGGRARHLGPQEAPPTGQAEIDLQNGDMVRVGHTHFEVAIEAPPSCCECGVAIPAGEREACAWVAGTFLCPSCRAKGVGFAPGPASVKAPDARDGPAGPRGHRAARGRGLRGPARPGAGRDGRRVPGAPPGRRAHGRAQDPAAEDARRPHRPRGLPARDRRDAGPAPSEHRRAARPRRDRGQLLLRDGVLRRRQRARGAEGAQLSVLGGGRGRPGAAGAPGGLGSRARAGLRAPRPEAREPAARRRTTGRSRSPTSGSRRASGRRASRA